MNEDNKKIIEINGVKVEVDLRTAKTVDTFKVGDNVKILVKSYSDSYKSHCGVIVGFDDFKNLPTIIVAYLDVDYSAAELKFAHINAKSEDIEMVAANENDLSISKERVIELFDAKLEKAKEAVREIETKKNYFLKFFNSYFK